MKYLVRVNDVKSKVDYMEQKLEIINENVKKLDALKTKLLWEGAASQRFIINYNQYISNLNQMQKMIIECIGVYELFYSRFGEEYNRLKKEYNYLYNTEVIQ